MIGLRSISDIDSSNSFGVEISKSEDNHKLRMGSNLAEEVVLE